MVDVSGKEETERVALAGGSIYLSEEAFRAASEGRASKGDVLNVARIAGIMAAKRTSELIPLCHNITLTEVKVSFESDPEKRRITVRCEAKTKGRTGVEMEALTGAGTALLTIYDMLKAVDRGMVIKDIRLLEKDGGKSGKYTYQEA